MINARRYHPTNSRFFTAILRHTYGFWLKIVYRCEGEGLDLFKRLKPPFILVGNHAMLVDPFISNYFVPHPVHWVASDGNMRTPIMRFLLIKLVGSIPKSKAIPDIETVNWIVELIRKRKGVVGFYPEGQTTWNGRSLPAFGSTAKLIKLLKAPVVCALSSGAYMSKPRWSYDRRPGGMKIAYSLLFDPEEIKKLSVAEIDARLNDTLSHDDPAWAKAEGARYESKTRAEKLELALYACPACGALHSLVSGGAILRCESCGMETEYGETGELILRRRPDRSEAGMPAAGVSEGSLLYDSLAGWDQWQESHLRSLIATRFATAPEQAIFRDTGARLLQGKRMDTMKRLGTGELAVDSLGILFTPEGEEPLRFPLSEIEAPGVLKWNHFEFYVGKTVYRANFAGKGDSARKYAVALELLAEARNREQAPE